MTTRPQARVAERDALCFSSARAIAARIRAKDVSAVEVVRAYLDRIDAVDRSLRAYITVTAEEALAAAARADRDRQSGRTYGPLHGVPVAIKDLDDVAGIRTTFGSVALRDTVPDRSATYVQRLLDAGAIVLG
jgi:amidase